MRKLRILGRTSLLDSNRDQITYLENQTNIASHQVGYTTYKWF